MVQERVRQEVRHHAVREIIAVVEAIRRPHGEPWVWTETNRTVRVEAPVQRPITTVLRGAIKIIEAPHRITVRYGPRRQEVRPIEVQVPEHEIAVLREALAQEATNRIEALRPEAVTIHPVVVVLQDRAVPEVPEAAREVRVPEVRAAHREVLVDPHVLRAEVGETKSYAQNGIALKSWINL